MIDYYERNQEVDIVIGQMEEAFMETGKLYLHMKK